MQTITDRELRLSALFGCEDEQAERSVLEAPDDASMVQAASAVIRRGLPAQPAPHLARIERVEMIMEQIRQHPEITQVAQLAALLGVSVRALQLLFRDAVGVSPKWVIRRNRLLDAADQLSNGATIDLATLAQQLGYYDQAHFTTDFEQLVGQPPASYRSACKP